MKSKVVGTVCFYGNSTIGAGWLAHVGPLNKQTKMLGDGEPKSGVTFTHALFSACKALKDFSSAIKPGDLVEVYAPGGQKVGLVNVCSPSWYGNIEWKPAGGLEVSAEEIQSVASA